MLQGGQTEALNSAGKVQKTLERERCGKSKRGNGERERDIHGYDERENERDRERDN